MTKVEIEQLKFRFGKKGYLFSLQAIPSKGHIICGNYSIGEYDGTYKTTW